MNGRLWSEDDDETLTDLYGSVEVETIAAQLTRTVDAVHNRAGKLRLGRRMPPGSLSGNDLMAALGTQDWRAINRVWIANGWLKATPLPRYGRADRPTMCVLEPDLARFLQEYPHLVDRDLVDPAYRQYVPERWITLVEAFRRGAAFYNLLENAVKAGLIPEARQRGEKGTRWAIPERLLSGLVLARRRMQSDADQLRLVRMYDRAQSRGHVQRKASYLAAKARGFSAGGRKAA